MSKNNHDENSDPSTTRSSMSISEQVVCEDEACIRQAADSERPATGNSGPEGEKKPAGSSMAVGGEEICTDDGCIGNN